MYGTDLNWKDKALIAAIAILINAAVILAIHWRAIFG
jgi:hypothetical protein